MIAVLHDLDLVRARFPSTLVLARRCVAWGATEVGVAGDGGMMSAHALLVAPFETLGFMRAALVACFALALANGAVGTLLVLRRMSLDGDVLGHAVMPGRRDRLPVRRAIADLAVARRAGERTCAWRRWPG